MDANAPEPEPASPPAASDAPELAGEAIFDEAEAADRKELRELQMELLYDGETEDEMLARVARIAELQERLGTATAPRVLKCAICLNLISVAGKGIISCSQCEDGRLHASCWAEMVDNAGGQFGAAMCPLCRTPTQQPPPQPVRTLMDARDALIRERGGGAYAD